MVSKILEKIASHEPAGIALDLYRDMPVPKRGDLVHHLNNTLTNHPNIIGISQIDLEEPDLTIKAPLVLRDQPTRVGENSFANDDDRMLRRGMLYFYSDAGIHPSLGLLMTAQVFGQKLGGIDYPRARADPEAAHVERGSDVDQRPAGYDRGRFHGDAKRCNRNRRYQHVEDHSVRQSSAV